MTSDEKLVDIAQGAADGDTRGFTALVAVPKVFPEEVARLWVRSERFFTFPGAGHVSGAFRTDICQVAPLACRSQDGINRDEMPDVP